jgi:hypothetical protein
VTRFLAAPEAVGPVAAEAFPDRVVGDRVIYRLPAGRGALPSGPPAEVRALTAADTEAVAGLSSEIGWIAKTWGGSAGLAGSQPTPVQQSNTDQQIPFRNR